MEGARDWDTRWERLEIGWDELGLHGRGQRSGGWGLNRVSGKRGNGKC